MRRNFVLDNYEYKITSLPKTVLICWVIFSVGIMLARGFRGLCDFCVARARSERDQYVPSTCDVIWALSHTEV